jgi:hypothetical protein
MEFIFSSRGGYRKLIVTADSKEQAIERFKEASKRGLTSGFELKDLPNITLAENIGLKVSEDIFASVK